MVAVSRVVGVVCLCAMAGLEFQFRARGGWAVSWPLLVGLYVVRTIAMNAIAPLEAICPPDWG